MDPLCFLALALGGAAAADDPAPRPNVLVIYTDDQGYGDVSALNPDAKFETPHFDRLAAEGVTFTHAHSADSVCTPSRYALLTGRYPWRTRLKRGVLGAEAEGLIPDGRTTLASLLRAKGYATAMVGKWHLGMDFPDFLPRESGEPWARDWSKPVLDMPLDKGFDYFFGIPASLNYGVLAWFRGRHAAVPPALLTAKKKNERHVDYRIMPPYEPFLREAKKRQIEVAPDFVDNQCLTRFTDEALAWLASRSKAAAEDEPFFLYLPLTSPHYPVCPLPEFHGKGEAGAYGEFVIETDHHLGRILAYLDEAGLADNTLVVFTSDNGPENSWRGRIEEFDHDSRGGLRGGKRSVYEGGHRVPFLVRWPKGIPQPGRIWSRPMGQVDLLATLADLLDVTLAPDAGEDSVSFAPVLLDPSLEYDRPPLIAHANGGGDFRYSITQGSWKLILPDGKRERELYDLSLDPGEANNVAADHPEVVDALTLGINRVIARGRTTPGPAQPNDTEHWKDLTWLSRASYEKLSAK